MNNNIGQQLLIVGVKHTVVAFDRNTGTRVWARELGSGISGNEYVTLLADDLRVYAHTYGEVFCLDLATGGLLWHDKLSGLGYGLASIAIPGGPLVSTSAIAETIRQQQNSNSVTAGSK